MTLSTKASIILGQIADLVTQILQPDFSKPSQILAGSSVGKHVRHTLEFFRCFQAGYTLGTINYDKRPHDALMESDKGVALNTIMEMTSFLALITTDKPLKLQTELDALSDRYCTIETTAMRELVYNIEHAVHHMAIIKIALPEIAPYVTVEKNFGIAASTTRHVNRVQAGAQ